MLHNQIRQTNCRGADCDLCARISAKVDFSALFLNYSVVKTRRRWGFVQTAPNFVHWKACDEEEFASDAAAPTHYIYRVSWFEGMAVLFMAAGKAGTYRLRATWGTSFPFLFTAGRFLIGPSRSSEVNNRFWAVEPPAFALFSFLSYPRFSSYFCRFCYFCMSNSAISEIIFVFA